MSKESILVFLGIFIVIVPFLGLPSAPRTTLLVISGFSVIFFALLLYARERLREYGRQSKKAPIRRKAKPKTIKNDVPIEEEATEDKDQA